MNALKNLARDWMPPAIARRLGRLLTRNTISFEGDFTNWEETVAKCTGYDAKNILIKVLAASIKVKYGEAAYERDSVIFDEIEYEWPVLAGLLMSASLNAGQLNVLDFGGALGSSYFQYRTILQMLQRVQWNVVEQQHYVEAGRTHIQNEQLRFYKTIESCVRENQPNLILLSSVLQYLPNPISTIIELMKLEADVIVIDKTIINHSPHDRIYIQHVPASIYSASYPCRSLSEPVLLTILGKNYRLLGEFKSLEFSTLKYIGSEFKGYVFHRQPE